MTGLAKRGSKRRCQNEQCALPFYDLNRAEIACPNCGASFVVETLAPIKTKTSWRTGRRPGPAWRTPEQPVEQRADPIDDAADDAVVEPADEAEVLLETDDEEEANVPIEPDARLATED